ncbi:helix-turn-helix domain-containing protein [Pseudohalocynthiibacter aestuariivivens]|uniref:Helix-turn-helix domain-containing protein n=1 Tax=Pseudohalocynthiibacter aestuariivivens TaxID=1591409 RepID=A0ABV5JED3_9RHOB|nr:helix-turn-helix domain-containing protein [Pseudohalocynthiibacter aestuariivivens]MBS9718821.1 helix-turn-helix domain-containing protein [Pseudohalocynthiibacter aestuariivivens]
MKGDSLDRIFAANVANVDSRLNAKANLVFSRLLFYRNSHSGLCNPSMEKLAFDLGCSSRTIRTAIRKLEKFGYVKTKRRWRGTRCNHYDLLIPSGRKAYDIAEEERFNYRKVPADKQKEEKNKEKRHFERRNSGTFAPTARIEVSAKESAKKLEAVHLKVVDLLGGGNQGWERFGCIPDEKRDCIDQLFRNGTLDKDQAVKKMLEALDEE